MNSCPDVALPIVFASMVPSESKYNYHHTISAREKYVLDLIIERNVEELIEYAFSTIAAPQILAEVLCYYCDWTEVQEAV